MRGSLSLIWERHGSPSNICPLRSFLALQSGMISVFFTKKRGKFGTRREATGEGTRRSSWTFRSDEGNLETPGPLPPWAVCYPGLENIWEVTEAVGEFQENQVMQRKESTTDDCSSIFALFSFTGGHSIFPDNIWKANIWLPQITDQNRSWGFVYSFWPDKERGMGGGREKGTQQWFICVIYGIHKHLKLLLLNLCEHEWYLRWMVLFSLYSFWTSDADPTNTPECKPDSVAQFFLQGHRN